MDYSARHKRAIDYIKIKKSAKDHRAVIYRIIDNNTAEKTCKKLAYKWSNVQQITLPQIL